MIIGISGKQGSGKDEVGKIIQNLLGNDWQIKKYADKLKDIVCLLIGCTREQLEDREFKEKELGEEWNYYLYNYTDSNISLITLDDYKNLGENQKSWLKLVKLTPRKILQLLGTECGRQIIHPNIWCNSLFSNYYGDVEIPSPAPNWIITDVRFPNELEAIKARGGITIRVNRHQTDNIGDSHSSETALDNAEFDHVIDNTGTLDDLIFKVKEILIKNNLL